MNEKTEGVRKIWDRYKYAALVALIGAGLLLWPGGGFNLRPSSKEPTEQEETEIRNLQKEMESILGSMNGVGQVQVMLTVDSDGERQLAQDTQLSYSGSTAAPEDYNRRTETVLVNGGGGAVTVRTTYQIGRAHV